MPISRRGTCYVALQFVLFIAYPFPFGDALLPVPPLIQWTAYGLIVFGLALVAVALLQLNRFLSPFPEPVVGNKLLTGGAFRLARHPIYTGILLAAAGGSIVTASVYRLAITGLLLLLFYFKSGYEEKLLGQQFPEYAAYRGRTGRFLTFR